MFIQVLKVVFESIKNNAHIRGLIIFSHVFSYTAFTDYSTIFLDGLKSVKTLINTFTLFFLFSGLKKNFSKSEITVICSLKGVLKSINLTSTIKILNVNFSHNNTLKVKKILYIVRIMQPKICFWNSIMLLLEGRMIIFKTLVICRIVRKDLYITLKNYGLTMLLTLKTLWWKLSWMENNSFSPYKQILSFMILFWQQITF